MILEAVVTSVSKTGAINIAPMGPHVADDYPQRLERFVLRPYPSSRTYANLCEHPEGVLHITDDVLLLAKSAIGSFEPLPPLRAADRIRGWILESSHRYYEFRIQDVDTSEQRIRLEAVVVASGRLRESFGLNRAKHAIVEAAILATRTEFLPLEEIAADFDKFKIVVEKTGGPNEREAMRILDAHLQEARNRQHERKE